MIFERRVFGARTGPPDPLCVLGRKPWSVLRRALKNCWAIACPVGAFHPLAPPHAMYRLMVDAVPIAHGLGLENGVSVLISLVFVNVEP